MSGTCRKCSSQLTICPTCKGKGMIWRTPGLIIGREETCPNCGGTGKLCPRHGRDWG